MNSLRGLRVWVTRPVAQAAASAKRWQARGATVHLAPLIGIHPLELSPDQRRACEDFGPDCVVLSSPNVAEHFARVFSPQSPGAAAWRCAAVGSRTAARAEELGLRVEMVASRATAEDLAAELLAHPVGQRYLLPGGDRQRPVLAERLGAGGASTLRCTLYSNRSLEVGGEEVERLRDFEPQVVAFYSPSAVESLVKQPPAMRACPTVIAWATVGETTAAAARRHGLDPVLSPDSPGEGPLIEEVERWWIEAQN